MFVKTAIIWIGSVFALLSQLEPQAEHSAATVHKYFSNFSGY
jgi:hypothetical protein